MKRAARVRNALLPVAILVAGCCSTPRAETYFDPAFDATEALRAFRYSVAIGRYGDAYGLVDASSKARVSRIAFGLAIRYGELPGVDLDVRTLILESRIVWEEAHPRDPNRRRIRVTYEDDAPTGGQIVAVSQVLEFVLETEAGDSEAAQSQEGELAAWRFDLVSSAERAAGVRP